MTVYILLDANMTFALSRLIDTISTQWKMYPDTVCIAHGKLLSGLQSV